MASAAKGSEADVAGKKYREVTHLFDKINGCPGMDLLEWITPSKFEKDFPN